MSLQRGREGVIKSVKMFKCYGLRDDYWLLLLDLWRFTKAVRYKEQPKMKRDIERIFIFGRLSYVTALL